MELPASPAKTRAHRALGVVSLLAIFVGAGLRLVVFTLSFWETRGTRLLLSLTYTGLLLVSIGLAGLLLGGLGRSARASWLQVLCMVGAIAFWTVAVIKLATTSGFDRDGSFFQWSEQAAVLASVALALGFVAVPLPRRFAHSAFAVLLALAVSLAVVANLVATYDMVFWFALAALPATLAAAVVLPYWGLPANGRVAAES